MSLRDRLAIFRLAKIFSARGELIHTLLSGGLRSKSKYWGRGNSGQGWIPIVAILICVSSVVGCTLPSPVTPFPQEASEESAPVVSRVLRDVLVIDQNDFIEILFVGSDTDSMAYTVFKAIDPLEVVLDLPDTVAETVPAQVTVDNEIVSKIEILTFTEGSASLVRVKIGLYRETPYRVILENNQVRVHLEKTASVSRSERPQVDAVAESGPEVLTAGRITGKEIDPYLPGSRESTSSSYTVEKEPLPPASVILSIDSVVMNQELRFYILADGSLANFNVFHLTDPPRVVVDLMDVQDTETPDVWNLDEPMVSSVETGLHEGKIRLVFRLVPKAGLPYEVHSMDHTLQISFTPGVGFPSR
jgi:hypothetical protein